MTARTNRADWVETAALGVSAACLAHCLLLPTLFTLLPALAAITLLPSDLHLWLLAAAVPMAAAALIHGRSLHGASGPLLAGAAGLTLMAAGASFWRETGAETPLTAAGVAMLTTAHLWNWRKRHGRGRR